MSDLRRRQLAAIHVAKKNLHLDDDTYRLMLRELGKVDSSKDLDAKGLERVLNHLRQLGGLEAKTAPVPGKPHNMKEAPELQKIEAFLAEAKRPWAYADGMAKRMYGKDRVAFCDPTELRGLIAALHRDAARHDRRTK